MKLDKEMKLRWAETLYHLGQSFSVTNCIGFILMSLQERTFTGGTPAPAV